MSIMEIGMCKNEYGFASDREEVERERGGVLNFERQGGM